MKKTLIAAAAIAVTCSLAMAQVKPKGTVDKSALLAKTNQIFELIRDCNAVAMRQTIAALDRSYAFSMEMRNAADAKVDAAIADTERCKADNGKAISALSGDYVQRMTAPNLRQLAVEYVAQSKTTMDIIGGGDENFSREFSKVKTLKARIDLELGR